MAMFQPIPLPNPSERYKDIFDYFEQVQKRKALQEQAQLENSMEQKKLQETQQYHQGLVQNANQIQPLKMDLLRAQIKNADQAKSTDIENYITGLENVKQKYGQDSIQYKLAKQYFDSKVKSEEKETPEQKKQRAIDTKIESTIGVEDRKAASKLQTSGRDLLSVINKANKIKQLLSENSNLTGLFQGGKAALNLSSDKKLAEFDQTTRKLQADMARYGSQRGGAQALKWAERAKPSTFKQNEYNIGMVNSIIEDAKADYDEMASEYKDRTGKDYPIKFPEIAPEQSTSGVVVMHKNGKIYHIPEAESLEAEKEGYSRG